MPQKSDQTPEKIDLDALLQLKRSERPTDAVWDQFDRELHQRMLQSLMKKEPWYLQVFRAFTGRMAQGTATAAAAALVLMLVARTALVTTAPSTAMQVAEVYTQPSAALEQSAVVVASTEIAEAEILTTPDYAIETYSAIDVAAGAGFQRDFGMDRIETANYDNAAYSADSALAHAAFANTSVASIAF